MGGSYHHLMEEEGLLLMAVVGVLGIVAQVLMGASAKNERSSRESRAKGADGSTSPVPAKRQSRRRSVKTLAEGGAGDTVDDLPMSNLLIPPPDDPRIEAVAPKNDLAQRPGR